MRMGSISVVVVFSSFLLFFSGGPGGLSPPEGRFPPPVPDMMISEIKIKKRFTIKRQVLPYKHLSFELFLNRFFWSMMEHILETETDRLNN